MRILVVEDEARLARQLATALGDAGYAVDCAADGERADFLGQTEEYDAVVLDLGLPKTDGLTVLRRWREAGISVPVLVLTARGSWHEKVRGIDEGADDYVSKPFRMEELLARLRALIRRASGQVTPALRCGAARSDRRSSKPFGGSATASPTRTRDGRSFPSLPLRRRYGALDGGAPHDRAHDFAGSDLARAGAPRRSSDVHRRLHRARLDGDWALAGTQRLVVG